MFRLLISLVLISFIATIQQAVAQSVPVTFNVNMSYQISEGNFNPENQFVDVAGDFNSWDGSDHVLEDENGDEIYSVTIDGFTPGSSIAFKFRIDGVWDGNEEFPGGGPNRNYTVEESDNEILVWYNDELPPTGPPIAAFSPTSTSVFTNGSVWFRDQSGGLVTEWEWHFEGGTPSVSKERNPVVTYQEPGVYDVTLIASHEDLSDEITIENAVEVRERESTELYWWNDAVFYEVFVRSFFDSSGDGTGDFQGLTEKLDYLNDGDPDSGESLGITGIWLMPIHESPSYHGYDVIDYYSVNSDHGTMNDFQEFLDAAHERGIKVIIDFVMNHSSRDHQWFINSRNNVDGYRDYYRWKSEDPGYDGPWGQRVWHPWGGEYYYGLFWGGMPDLNFENPEVKDKMFDAAGFWLNDIGVDGFRLDAVTYIFEDGDQLEHTEETFEFWHEFNEFVKEQNPDAVTVGEAWTNTDQIIPYVTNDRLDMAFEFDLSYAILNTVRNGNSTQLASHMQKVYDSYEYMQYATFLTNHDQNRVMNELNNNWEQAKTAASIYLTLPGVPFIYYGEEIGMTGAKPDPQIRTPMQWTDGTNAGFTTGNPWINLNSDFEIRNVAVQEEDPNSLLNWYKTLISIRNGHPSLRRGAYNLAGTSDDAVYTFLRQYEDEALLVVINTSSSSKENIEISVPGIDVDPGNYPFTDLITGDEVLVPVEAGNRITNQNLGPYQTVIYSIGDSIPVSVNDDTETPRSINLEQNYPNPFNPVTVINFDLPQSVDVSLNVYNVLGQRVATLVNEVRNTGRHSVTFDASRLSSGVYIYRLVAGGTALSRKMMLVK